MLKFEQICELVRLVGETGLSKVEIQEGGSRLLIKGAPAPTFVQAGEMPVGAAGPPPLPQAGTPGGPEEAPSADEGLEIVTSPIVGTFYRAPNPDAEPYAKVGDSVEVGQVLCIVEAMKLMNEINSEISGTLVKVFPENAEAVEFGRPLFAIKPA